MPRYSPQREQLTSNGIRIVGSAAVDLAARAATIQLAPPPPNDRLWVARFKVRPRLGGGSPVPAILKCLGEALRSEWDACPAVTRDTPFTRPQARFQGISWDVIGEAGAWRGELIWRHPHPVLAGTPCTTHLILDEQQHAATLTLIAAADGGLGGVRGIVGAGQSRPPILTALQRVVVMTSDGFEATPRILAESEVAPFVRESMLSDTRAWPVAVLAPLEDGGYIVPPEQLAQELFGLAPLYVMDRHSTTFKLTDELGDRRLSAYWGALRVYKPEFSCADRSDDHWLLMRDRLDDPLERAALIGKLGQFAADRLVAIEGVNERRIAVERASPTAGVPSTPPPAVLAESPSPVTPSVPTADQPPAGAEASAGAMIDTGPVLSTLAAAIQDLGVHMRELAGTIGHLVSANADLADEVARLRTATAIRATGTNAMERRLATIESLLKPGDIEPPVVALDEEVGGEESDSLPTLSETVRQAGSEYGDALLILESAEDSAGDSPFEDVDRLAAVLQAMAFVARRRQEGGLDSGLRAAFQELGVDYRSGIAKSTSDKLRRQYQFTGADGREYECPEHIAIGPKTYDPRHCLRIYFTSRAPSEPRFVIGHVGRHFKVMTST